MRDRTKRKEIEIDSSSSDLSKKSKKHKHHHKDKSLEPRWKHGIKKNAKNKPAKHRQIQLVKMVDIKIIDGNREPAGVTLCKILIDGKQGWFITAAVIFNFYFNTTTIELQNAGILENCVQINLDPIKTTTKRHVTYVFSAQEFYKALLYIITDPEKQKRIKDKARAFIQIFFKRKSDTSEDCAEESAEKIADKYTHTWSSNVIKRKVDLTFDLKTFDIVPQTNPLLAEHGLFAASKSARQSDANINIIASATVNPMPMAATSKSTPVLHAKAAAASQPMPLLPMPSAISFPASHVGELASFSHLLQARLLPVASLSSSHERKQINVEKNAKDDTLQPPAIADIIPKVATPESMAKAAVTLKGSTPVATDARSEPSAMGALAPAGEIPMFPLPLPFHSEKKANSDLFEFYGLDGDGQNQTYSLLAEQNSFALVPTPKSPRFWASNDGMLNNKDNEEDYFDLPSIFPDNGSSANTKQQI